MYLAQNIRCCRKKKGLNQNEMAEILGISQSAIANWEKGSRSPDIEMIVRLADYFKVSLDDLVLKDLRPPVPLYASNLRYLRKNHGIKLSEIAEMLGVKEVAASKYEYGRIQIDVEKLEKLADFFGVTLDQMVKQDLSKEKKGVTVYQRKSE